MQPLRDQDYAGATATGNCVVVFKMDFCPPCRLMINLLNRLAPQYPQLHFFSLTVNREPQVAQLLGVKQAPTLLFKRQGHIVGALVGPQTLTTLRQHLVHYFGRTVPSQGL